MAVRPREVDGYGGLGRRCGGEDVAVGVDHPAGPGPARAAAVRRQAEGAGHHRGGLSTGKPFADGLSRCGPGSDDDVGAGAPVGAGVFREPHVGADHEPDGQVPQGDGFEAEFVALVPAGFPEARLIG